MTMTIQPLGAQDRPLNFADAYRLAQALDGGPEHFNSTSAPVPYASRVQRIQRRADVATPPAPPPRPAKHYIRRGLHPASIYAAVSAAVRGAPVDRMVEAANTAMEARSPSTVIVQGVSAVVAGWRQEQLDRAERGAAMGTGAGRAELALVREEMQAVQQVSVESDLRLLDVGHGYRAQDYAGVAHLLAGINGGIGRFRDVLANAGEGAVFDRMAVGGMGESMTIGYAASLFEQAGIPMSEGAYTGAPAGVRQALDRDGSFPGADSLVPFGTVTRTKPVLDLEAALDRVLGQIDASTRKGREGLAFAAVRVIRQPEAVVAAPLELDRTLDITGYLRA